MNNPQAKYLRSVKRVLPFSYQNRRKYLDNLSESLRNYCLEHPAPSLEQLLTVFGSPEDILESLYLEENGKTLKARTIQRQRRILWCTLSLLLLITFAGVLLFRLLSPKPPEADPFTSCSYTEDIQVLQTSVIDISGFASTILASQLDKISATKTITCLNADQAPIWKVELTTDFVPHEDASLHELQEFVREAPEIAIEILDDNYQVEVLDTLYACDKTVLILQITTRESSMEQTFTFSCDKNGSLF